MKFNVNKENQIYLYRVLCILIVAVSMLPISCNYILNSGMVLEWVGRIKEMAAGLGSGEFIFFPGDVLVEEMSVKSNAFNSNGWFILPAVLYYFFENPVLSYRLYMLFLQLGTAWTAMLFLRRMFGAKSERIAVLFGFLLYMTCPYRISICYEQADLSQAVVWMLLPLYGWALCGLLRSPKHLKEAVWVVVSLAGIGYADTSICVIICIMTLLIGIIKKSVSILVAVAGGILLWAPGWIYWLQSLLDNPAMQIEAISDNGYELGEFWAFYLWQEGHPGMGMGMFVCLLAGAWMYVVNQEQLKRKGHRCLWTVAVITGVMSLRCFPWDWMQRTANWVAASVTMMETPTIFWGFANCILVIIAAGYADQISKNENKLIKTAIPILVLLFGIGGCIYQCNLLMYECVPLFMRTNNL